MGRSLIFAAPSRKYFLLGISLYHLEIFRYICYSIIPLRSQEPRRSPNIFKTDNGITVRNGKQKAEGEREKNRPKAQKVVRACNEKREPAHTLRKN